MRDPIAKICLERSVKAGPETSLDKCYFPECADDLRSQLPRDACPDKSKALFDRFSPVISRNLDRQVRNVAYGIETFSYNENDPVQQKKGYGSSGLGVEAVERLVNVVRRDAREDAEKRRATKELYDPTLKRMKVDGTYDAELKAEIERHQLTAGLPVTGVVDENTFESLAERAWGANESHTRGALMGRAYLWKVADQAVKDVRKIHGSAPSAALVMAVGLCESAFDPFAVSPAKAKGVMQLSPEAVEQWEVDDPFDVEENVRAGTLHLAWLLSRYDGNLRLALSAYNAGPENVRRWLEEKAGQRLSDKEIATMTLKEEDIPWDETRGYAPRVERALAAFTASRSRDLELPPPTPRRAKSHRR